MHVNQLTPDVGCQYNSHFYRMYLVIEEVTWILVLSNTLLHRNDVDFRANTFLKKRKPC